MLHIEITHYNASAGHGMGTPQIRQAEVEDPGELFRMLRTRYGRCVQKIYHERWDATRNAVGWVFERVRTYVDVPTETYLERVSITLLEDDPARFFGARQYRTLAA